MMTDVLAHLVSALLGGLFCAWLGYRFGYDMGWRNGTRIMRPMQRTLRR